MGNSHSFLRKIHIKPWKSRKILGCLSSILSAPGHSRVIQSANYSANQFLEFFSNIHKFPDFLGNFHITQCPRFTSCPEVPQTPGQNSHQAIKDIFTSSNAQNPQYVLETFRRCEMRKLQPSHNFLGKFTESGIASSHSWNFWGVSFELRRIPWKHAFWGGREELA